MCSDIMVIVLFPSLPFASLISYSKPADKNREIDGLMEDDVLQVGFKEWLISWTNNVIINLFSFHGLPLPWPDYLHPWLNAKGQHQEVMMNLLATFLRTREPLGCRLTTYDFVEMIL